MRYGNQLQKGSISGCMSRNLTSSEKYTVTLLDNRILQAVDSTVNRLKNIISELLEMIGKAMTYKLCSVSPTFFINVPINE